jgi:hypothetical protein
MSIRSSLRALFSMVIFVLLTHRLTEQLLTNTWPFSKEGMSRENRSGD